MMGFVKFMQKRPSDLTIRLGRIFFGLILIGTLYYNFLYQATPNELETNFFWQDLNTTTIEYIKYTLIALGIIPLFMGLVKVCILKKKYMRIIQIIFGIFLFYISSKIVEGSTLDIDALLLFMGFLPLIAGITGKCIPTYCMKFAEKITKIRI